MKYKHSEQILYIYVGIFVNIRSEIDSGIKQIYPMEGGRWCEG